MDLWFNEKHTDSVNLSLKIQKQIVSITSKYQQIDIFESVEFGKILVLDGVLMFTEKDEFIYHEMITHPAFGTNPNIKNVLVIGAGDGGVARELLKYNSIQSIDLIEIDEDVINACKTYIPSTAQFLDNPKINILIQDGLKYVRKCTKMYDLIIVDSTDPTGPGEVLFTKEFYGNCYKILAQNGILINQHESPFYANDALNMQKAHKKINEVFGLSMLYQSHIPTYPSGHWLFGFASKGLNPLTDCKAEEWNSLGINTRYYNTDIHLGSFALPNYVKELIKNAK